MVVRLHAYAAWIYIHTLHAHVEVNAGNHARHVSSDTEYWNTSSLLDSAADSKYIFEP